MQEFEPLERIPAVIAQISSAVKVFMREGKEDPIVLMYEEIKKLGAYLTHRKDVAGYQVEKVEAEKKLENLRKSYVAAQLYEFDKEAMLVEKQRRWTWSPLYALMKSCPSKDFKLAPWEHTEDELQSMILSFDTKDSMSRFSLERECPHILWALKLFVRQTHGCNLLLAHPIEGPTSASILAYAKSTSESVRLTIVVEDLIRHGWLHFPAIFTNEEPLE